MNDSHATPSQVKDAFLKLVYTATKSPSLVQECTEIYDNKAMPESVQDGKLRLR